jgi:hypothetical protein
VILGLPLRVRNQLAETIIAAFGDAAARRELERLTAGADPPPGWLTPPEQRYASTLRERAGRAASALAGWPLASPAAHVDVALAVAARLFDAGLYFETHEVLEPHWRGASGELREVLQGLIQVAVGYQHWFNLNFAGARSLLEEGSSRLRNRRLRGLDLEDFARAVQASASAVGDRPPTAPPFPRSDANLPLSGP